MKQAFHRLSVRTRGKGLTMITSPIVEWVAESGIQDGLLTLWCRHTSASLIVQENADPTVQQDINSYFEDLVPETRSYRHDYEGSDDMPAHIRSVLTNVQLTIPVMGGRPVLGTWQGIYLFEHRRASHGREIVSHLLGD
ncbi:secondary thiamine-phosphate synthase enzyme YjbQ [Asaia lannensis]|uniref:secondary thiamine-phosphate synthase enzyme YjbQ n=1 Tax=Asaia lannensis TaxID=415421 RepID=UPI00387324A5